MKFLCLSLLCFLYSCGMGSEPDYVKLSDKISIPFYKEVQKQKGYALIAYGGAFYKNVAGVSLTFYAPKSMTLRDARREYVELVEELLLLYNQNEEIRPFLDVYPFRPANIHLGLMYDSTPVESEETFVWGLQMIDGKIVYSYPESTSQKKEDEIWYEPYEEAYRKVYGHDRPTP